MSTTNAIDILKERAQTILTSQETHTQDEIKNIFLSLAMNEIDFDLAATLCGKFIKSSDDTLRMIAIICVGHIARVYHQLVNPETMVEMERIYADKTHPNWGEVDDALDDIEMFLKIPKPMIDRA